MAKLPLSHINVLDLTAHRAGPTAVRQLADWGANVIKIEMPPDDSGAEGPGGPREGSDFQNLHRNKRSITLDLKNPKGKEVFMKLVKDADVVVENYRPDVKFRLGIDYESLKKVNPRIVVTSISGFGQDGAYAQFPASDTVLQALSGLMQQVGTADGPPLRVGFPLIDLSAANNAVQGILAALYGRLSGKNGNGGAEIDVSLMASAMALMNVTFTDYLAGGRLPQRHGNQNPQHAPAGAYETAGGRYITLAILRDAHWKKLCAALGMPALTDDTRFSNNALRVANRTDIHGWLLEVFDETGKIPVRGYYRLPVA